MANLYGGRSSVDFKNESYERRLRELPLRDGWCVSSGDSFFKGSGATVQGSTAVNRMHFLMLDRRYEQVSAKSCRVRVDTLAASQTFVCALYAEIDGALFMIQGSKATLSTSVVGLINSSVNCEIRPDKRYFLGYTVSSVTPLFAGISSGYSPLVDIPYLDIESTSSLPTNVHLNNLSSGNVTTIPLVLYISQEAMRWL